MEPRIQYVKTSDGVNIAYAGFGDGPPIVYVGGGFADIHMYSSGGTPSVDTLVGLGHRVIMYDGRGTGSSDRDIADLSFDGRLRDLEAVIERLAGDRFALWGILQGGPACIVYATRHSDRVLRLVLSATYAKGADWYKILPGGRATRALDTMAEEQWEYDTLLLASTAIGFTDSDLANRLAAAMRSGTSARTYLSYRATNEKIDVTELLPSVNAPTLVVNLESSPFSNVNFLRVLASRIPNARLVRLAAPEELAPAIDAFLREGEEQTAPPPPARPHVG